MFGCFSRAERGEEELDPEDEEFLANMTVEMVGVTITPMSRLVR